MFLFKSCDLKCHQEKLDKLIKGNTEEYTEKKKLHDDEKAEIDAITNTKERDKRWNNRKHWDVPPLYALYTIDKVIIKDYLLNRILTDDNTKKMLEYFIKNEKEWMKDKDTKTNIHTLVMAMSQGYAWISQGKAKDAIEKAKKDTIAIAKQIAALKKNNTTTKEVEKAKKDLVNVQNIINNRKEGDDADIFIGMKSKLDTTDSNDYNNLYVFQTRIPGWWFTPIADWYTAVTDDKNAKVASFIPEPFPLLNKSVKEHPIYGKLKF